MPVAAESCAVQRPQSQARWLIGPAADLLVIANVAWPLFMIVLWYYHGALYNGFELYLSSVIGTPHRWVTLPIVAVDRERLAHRWPLLSAVALSTALFDGALWWWTRDVGLLLMVRYLWNIWHVAAQHGGLARIYAIRCQPERRTSGKAEKYLLRSFIIYAFLRAGSVGGSFLRYQWLLHWLQTFSIADGRFDAAVALIPAGLLAREFLSFDRRLLTRYIHLASVCINYTAMIAFCHFGMNAWVFAISGATAVFHALEYYGFLSWWMGRRAQRAETLFFPSLARNWTSALVLFLHCMAAITLIWSVKFTFAWVMANTLVSYLHYAYDAVLWKMPVLFKPRKALNPA